MTKHGEIDQAYLIRPVAMDDLDALLALILCSSGGLSSLQPRKDFLKKYIKGSIDSFAGILPIESPHKYLMVMIDVAHDRLIGCAAVKTQIGQDSPFINFDLFGDGESQVLKASSRFTGATEVGSLFLHPDYRDSGLGRYLTKVRYLLMAHEPWRFGETVVAELRGICGTEGSPLYDHLFAYKLDKTFLEADAEYFDRNPDTLGEIVPLGAVSVYNMPVGVKASLGQPHPSGIGAMRLLQSEGFIFSGTVDLFDGGPIMAAHRDTIRTIMASKTEQIVGATDAINARTALITAGSVSDFRAVVAPAAALETGLFIAPYALPVLDAEVGDTVTYWQGEPPRRKAQNTPSPVQAQVNTKAKA
ncbi:arginine N-succinyltransferase [Fretibacter rubidus]|uniref:arginine N-succinyltransferase n=1 Tax=Fretibacter rubidus TaxID=570162 RepID=UPI00352A8AFC